MNRRTLAFALPLAIAPALASLAVAEPPALTGSHATLACDRCHRDGALADCDACHDPAANPHPVGGLAVAPLPEPFRLGPAGEVLCRTCHRLHGGDPAFSFLANGGQECLPSVPAFCSRCHEGGMAAVSPHRARAGLSRCVVCHPAVPPPAADGAPAVRGVPDALCDFCHAARRRGHPQDVSPRLPLPRELPVSPGGEATCVTCHDPHGTATTTHHLRPAFSRHYGRGQEDDPHRESYFACRSCHTTAFADEIRAPGYRLLYQGDCTVLCLSCHVTARGHHPTGIPLPGQIGERFAQAARAVPLDDRGRITCCTCHDNGCGTGRQGMRLRHFDRSASRNDLCWICHSRSDFAAHNPHADDPSLCSWCHESHPLRREDARQSLAAGPTMVCLRCHEALPHPGNADHLRVPSEKIHPDASLPREAGGRITCATCHDPHMSAIPLPRRLRISSARLCSRCHW